MKSLTLEYFLLLIKQKNVPLAKIFTFKNENGKRPKLDVKNQRIN